MVVFNFSLVTEILSCFRVRNEGPLGERNCIPRRSDKLSGSLACSVQVNGTTSVLLEEKTCSYSNAANIPLGMGPTQ